jgi:hypothetical protein
MQSFIIIFLPSKNDFFLPSYFYEIPVLCNVSWNKDFHYHIYPFIHNKNPNKQNIGNLYSQSKWGNQNTK